jgi:phage terminase large subunit-like protein
MPWQQYVADVVGEIDPATGRLAYSEWGLTVPRQSGKSTFVLAKATHRCSASGFFGPRQKVVYTAQTRQKAREKWEEDYAEELLASASFKSRVQVHKGNGNEHIRFTNGSRFGIEASTEKAGHGGTLDEAYIDEAFAQVDARLEQAFGPAMITRPLKQLAWISTAGWLDGSPYLLGKVRAGRGQVESDGRRGLAYFEWSAPESADPADPGVWWSCMPALGTMFPEEAIRAEYDKAVREEKLNDFRRAYLNQWVPKSADVEAAGLDFARWEKAADPSAPRGTELVFGVATAPDRSWSAVVAAWRRPDGAVQVAIGRDEHGNHDYRRGTAWVEERVEQLRRRYGGVVVADVAARGLVSRAEQPGEDAQALAHNRFSDLLEAGGLRHGNQPALNTAVGAARWRSRGNTQVLDRKGDVDITPVAAAALAAHRVTSNDVPAGGWLVGV